MLILCGGKSEVFERGKPIYSAFCKDILHLGDIGAGQFGKAMNNFLLWVNGVALIEAGRLSEANGMDLVKLREALLMSSGASDALKNWENVSFLWALKDMQIVAKMADKAGLAMPIAGAIKELVKDGRRIKQTNPPDWTGRGSKARNALNTPKASATRLGEALTTKIAALLLSGLSLSVQAAAGATAAEVCLSDAPDPADPRQHARLQFRSHGAHHRRSAGGTARPAGDRGIAARRRACKNRLLAASRSGTPDGYTLIMMHSGIRSPARCTKALKYDTVGDFQMLSQLILYPFVLRNPAGSSAEIDGRA